ncbi:hypothetical protein NLX67_15050 [Domibacillus sp. A3M-37]|uniref:hypothetical protein n=1 Tax=Domibacillus sp. A3M-37 TaxID=2962037 RepID=UPI0020B6A92A|nr:hypothetical protein [Domibacillus sp. A3M-37]MCP3763692.1 hypothetical protein [Domibacillus sp. A3M-37]
MEQHPVVIATFEGGLGRFSDFFESELLAYRFAKEMGLWITNVRNDSLSQMDYRMLFM